MCLSVSTIPIGLIVGIQGFNASLLFLILIFIVTFCFSLLVSHLITRPIISLTKNLDKISKGQLEVKLDRSEIHEINDLTDSLNRIMASLKLAIHKFGVKKGEIFDDALMANDNIVKKPEDCQSIGLAKQNMAIDKIKDLNKEISDLKIKINDLQNKRKSKSYETVNISKEKLDDNWSEQEFDSVFFFDINANILDCNENICKGLGYSKDEMLLLNMADFDILETKKELSKKINATKKNGVFSFKTIHKRKDGSTFLVFENLQYIKDKNMFKCIVRKE
jgi:PAS domain S-box-containing protein